MFQLNDDLTTIILKVHVKHDGTQNCICLLFCQPSKLQAAVFYVKVTVVKAKQLNYPEELIIIPSTVLPGSLVDLTLNVSTAHYLRPLCLVEGVLLFTSACQTHWKKSLTSGEHCPKVIFTVCKGVFEDLLFSPLHFIG